MPNNDKFGSTGFLLSPLPPVSRIPHLGGREKAINTNCSCTTVPETRWWSCCCGHPINGTRRTTCRDDQISKQIDGRCKSRRSNGGCVGPQDGATTLGSGAIQATSEVPNYCSSGHYCTRKSSELSTDDRYSGPYARCCEQ